MSAKISILSYRPDLAPHFKTVNEEWISEMFVMEPKDIKVLENPQSEIIDGGGHIFFAQAEGLGVVGAVALLKTGEGEYELTKMGVLKSARGLDAGKHLIKAAIEKANSLGAKNLYLLTNKKCEAAIHIYEQHGFEHDGDIMKRFGSEYDRCDVAMRYRKRD